MSTPTGIAALAVTVLGASTLTFAVPASAHTTGIHDNCTSFNKAYPHGVGRAGARDRVSGRSGPVTSFKRSTAIYRIAVHHNSGLDRDHDGVACEKR
jgi:hypothetical protein